MDPFVAEQLKYLKPSSFQWFLYQLHQSRVKLSPEIFDQIPYDLTNEPGYRSLIGLMSGQPFELLKPFYYVIAGFIYDHPLAGEHYLQSKHADLIYYHEEAIKYQATKVLDLFAVMEFRPKMAVEMIEPLIPWGLVVHVTRNCSLKQISRADNQELMVQLYDSRSWTKHEVYQTLRHICLRDDGEIELLVRTLEPMIRSLMSLFGNEVIPQNYDPDQWIPPPGYGSNYLLFHSLLFGSGYFHKYEFYFEEDVKSNEDFSIQSSENFITLINNGRHLAVIEEGAFQGIDYRQDLSDRTTKLKSTILNPGQSLTLAVEQAENLQVIAFDY